jgi:hypothetical protein
LINDDGGHQVNETTACVVDGGERQGSVYGRPCRARIENTLAFDWLMPLAWIDTQNTKATGLIGFERLHFIQ